MGEHLVRKIYDISKEYGVDEAVVYTNHLKFVGNICECKEGRKDDDFLTLTDSKIWRLKDICNCNEPECKNNENNFYTTEWIHINVSKIVAFTLKKPAE